MAAAIKNKFGITAKLIEGHNGIYEVAVNGDMIFANQGKCNQRPKEEQIFEEIQKYITPLPAEDSDAVSSDIYEKKRSLDIEFMYLDLSVCTWCQGTESNLEEAVADAAQVLKATGVEVNVKKIHVQSEEQARELGFVSSPTIRINGKDIQLDVKESLCDSCGDLCGDSVDCRVWTYQGKEYTAPPKGMIIDAILREIYGGSKKKAVTPSPSVKVPENLRRFFTAKSRKNENETVKAVDSCCSPSSNDPGCT